MVMRYLFFWLVLAVIAIVNGTIRQFVYGPVMPELAAHQLSTLTGILFTGDAVWLLDRSWPIEKLGEGGLDHRWVLVADDHHLRIRIRPLRCRPQLVEAARRLQHP